jgi:hypothetical protein
MKRISIGCGLLVFIVWFIVLSGLVAYWSVFSYYAEHEERDPQTQASITNELWLQGMLHHSVITSCYTLDATLCATAELVQTYSISGGTPDDFWLTVVISAVPALICAAVLWRILWWYRRRPKTLD